MMPAGHVFRNFHKQFALEIRKQVLDNDSTLFSMRFHLGILFFCKLTRLAKDFIINGNFTDIVHRRRRNHIVIKFLRIVEIRVLLHFRHKNTNNFLCTLEMRPSKAILVIDHFGHTHKHLVLEQANLILIVLDKSSKFCVVCVQAFNVALDICFIFNTEQAYLQFLILMHNRLEIAILIRETVNLITARILQLSHAFLKDIRNFGILGQIMVHTAIQQFREIATCNIVATQIQALR